MTEPAKKRPIGARWLNGKTPEELAAESRSGPLPPQQLGYQGPPPQAPPVQQWPAQPPYYAPAYPPERRKGMAIAALVLGIGALVFSFTLAILAFPALGAAVTGLVLACVAYSDQKMAKWALWISIIAVGTCLYDVIVFLQALHRLTGS